MVKVYTLAGSLLVFVSIHSYIYIYIYRIYTKLF